MDEKLGFSHYINTLNSFRNPDILTGDATKVLKGNKYRAKMVNEEKEREEAEEKEREREEAEEKARLLAEKKVEDSKSDSEVCEKVYMLFQL